MKPTLKREFNNWLDWYLINRYENIDHSMLESAFIAGAKAMAKDTCDTLSKFAIAVEDTGGSLTNSDALENARINLFNYYGRLFNKPLDLHD